MFFTTIILAVREIRRHLLRSFLTTLGIVIGVAAVVTMVTLGKGATEADCCICTLPLMICGPFGLASAASQHASITK